MKEPIVHVIRSRPPWRSEQYDLTECGVSPVEFESITRDEFLRRLHELGKQRTALFTCMTCFNCVARWPTFKDRPTDALSREFGMNTYGGRQHPRLKVEVLALAQLVEEHREEFETIIKRYEWAEGKKPKRGWKRGGIL